jgi:Ca-activated chloride channel family protein
MHVTAHLDVDLVAHESDDSVTALLQLQAPLLPSSAARPGQTLVVVLDRSGSMGGAPLTAAKAALRDLVRRLAPHDRFGLVVFDHAADLVVPVRPVGTHDLGVVDQLLSRIDAGGSTDLSAGYALALREAGRSLAASQDDGAVAAGATVLVISDGHANVGDTDAESLRQRALAHTKGQHITTATIGLGLGYDEVLLAAMADGGSGSHLFASGADDLPATIGEELDGLLDKSVLAATVRVTGRDGHLLGVGVLQGLPTWQEGETTVVALGDLYAGEERKTLVRLDVASIPALGLATIADVVLEYTALPDQAEHTVTLPITVNVVPGDVAAKRVPEPEVVVQKMLLEANEAKTEAAQALRSGDEAGAKRALRAASDRLGSLSGALAVLRQHGTMAPEQEAELQAALAEEASELALLDQRVGVAPAAQMSKTAMYSQSSGRRGRSPKEHLRRARSGGSAQACPRCGAELLPIAWGMPASDPGPGVIVGGCVLPPEPQSHGCPACGWRGVP